MGFQIAEAYVTISQRGAGTTTKALTAMGKQAQQSAGMFGKLNASSGQLDFALRNAIYAAEDAASVYGTQGLSGVLRATSNNITPILGLMGPLGMGLGVAAMAGTQLWMALDKTGDSAEQAQKDLEKYRDTLKGTADRIDQLVRLRRDLRNADDSGDTGGTREKLLADRESLDARIAHFEKQAEQARREQEKLEALGKMKDMQAAGTTNRPLATVYMDAAESFRKQASVEGMHVKAIEEQRMAALEERKRLTEEIALVERRHQELVRKEVVQANLEKTRGIEQEIALEKQKQAEQQAMFDAQKKAADAQAKAYADLVEKANRLYGIEIDKNGKAFIAGRQSVNHAETALGIEQERRRVSSQMMSASQLANQIQSSIQMNPQGGDKFGQMSQMSSTANQALEQAKQSFAAQGQKMPSGIPQTIGKMQNVLAGMSKRDRAGFEIAAARAMEAKSNDRGLFKERKDKEGERTNQLLERMLNDGLKTKSGAATAG